MPQIESPSPDAAGGWPARLMAALEVDGVAPDFARLARTARIAAAASGADDDAAATAFIAGYAVGLAEGTGQAGFDRAHAASLRGIERLLAAELPVAAPTAGDDDGGRERRGPTPGPAGRSTP